MASDPGTHHLGTDGWLRLAVVAVLALVFIATLEASPAAGASRTACQVTNAQTGETFHRLQRAVNAAKRSARLMVRGSCQGRTFIWKDMAILGATVRGRSSRIFDGGPGSRLLVVMPGITVNIGRLVFAHGARQWRQQVDPYATSRGCIRNEGTLSLRDIVVRRCEATNGSAIVNKGTVRVVGHSRVNGNVGTAVYNYGHLTLGGASLVRGNGCGVANWGTLILDGTSNIGGNRWSRGHASGCAVSNLGTFVMNDTSSISDQRSLDGGATYNTGAFVMNDASSIHHNTSVPSAATDLDGGEGGGVWNAGSLTMNDSSSIHDNIAEGGDGVEGRGGGLYNASGGVLVGVNCGANVSGNTPDDCYFE
jgi:hypothetical protein